MFEVPVNSEAIFVSLTTLTTGAAGIYPLLSFFFPVKTSVGMSLPRTRNREEKLRSPARWVSRWATIAIGTIRASDPSPMLRSLRIENFALIDSLFLEFGLGLNVLTGETGAGKSIILDALDAALGGKIQGRAIRTGADRAAIEATFEFDPQHATRLADCNVRLGNDRRLTCQREIVAGKRGARSRYRLNGVATKQKQVEQLRDRCVEITAQGQTVQLGQPAVQRELLDLYGGSPLLQQLQEVGTAFKATQKAKQALDRRRQFEEQRLQQLDLFTYQLQELEAAHLEDSEELNQLEAERSRLSHVVDLKQQSYQVYQSLYQNDSNAPAAADLLGDAENILTEMVTLDPQLQPLLDLVEQALVQVMESGNQINAYGEELEVDPQRLQEVEDRIRTLKQICRKYGPTLGEAIDRYRELLEQTEELDGKGASIEGLEKVYQERQEFLDLQCQKLNLLRQSAARELENRLISLLEPLAMKKVKFQVNLTPIPATSTGSDRVTFMLSANPGEPLQPLAETASGGEMSRFLLALKACFSEVDAVETLVFDEIDVGVSGRVAKAIAEKLHQLGSNHQVLCVTHQPLVAAMADRHFRVDKHTTETGERTIVRVTPLDTEQRRQELAQLAGGKSDREAVAFAQSLLVAAGKVRSGESR